VGESAGFADPILSAGLTLTHVSAREAAFTLLELLRAEKSESPSLSAGWLKREYTTLNRHRVSQHIRFADYWYSANAHFSELKEFTRSIAKDAGLDMDADSAWQWLGTGGFADTEDGEAGIGGYSIGAVNDVLFRLANVEPSKEMPHSGASGFYLNIKDAERSQSAWYENGKVVAIDTFSRGQKRLKLRGPCGWIAMAFSQHQRVDKALEYLASLFPPDQVRPDSGFWNLINNAMDGMVRDGWLVKKSVPSAPVFTINYDVDNAFVAANTDSELPPERRAASIGQSSGA
jgi:hypothetical protein